MSCIPGHRSLQPWPAAQTPVKGRSQELDWSLKVRGRARRRQKEPSGCGSTQSLSDKRHPTPSLRLRPYPHPPSISALHGIVPCGTVRRWLRITSPFRFESVVTWICLPLLSVFGSFTKTPQAWAQSMLSPPFSTPRTPTANSHALCITGRLCISAAMFPPH